MSDLNILSQFYLHTNGELIFKTLGGVDEKSTFVIKLWEVDSFKSPGDFCIFLAEAHHLGASFERIKELANKNELSEFIPDWERIVTHWNE